MIHAVKPECGKDIYRYLSQPDLYDCVPVIQGAREGVAALREKGYRVVFLTSCTKGMTDQKWEWLERHGFLQSESRGNADLIIAHDKSLIRATLLIDDYDGNFKGWNGSGILFSAPYNAHFDPPYNIVRADSWSTIVEMVQVAVPVVTA
jgi:5'-nucleotidase